MYYLLGKFFIRGIVTYNPFNYISAWRYILV